MMTLTIQDLETIKEMILPELKRQVMDEVRKELSPSSHPTVREMKFREMVASSKSTIQTVLDEIKSLMPNHVVVVANNGIYRGCMVTYAVAHVCRNLDVPVPYVQMGLFFKKDHSTVVWWTAQCEKIMEKNPDYKMIVEQTISKLNNGKLS